MMPLDDVDVRRLYGDLTWVWEIVSSPEEYAEETEFYARVIREHAQIPVRRVLALGCGAGNIEYTLKKHFDVTGVDASETMLKRARRRNPEVSYVQGDMRTVRLDETFDAVTILDSEVYMHTTDELRAGFATAYTHLVPGGCFLTLVEYTAEDFVQNKITSETKRAGDTEVVFIENNCDPDPTDTTFEATFVFLIRRAGEFSVEVDRHVLGLFPLATWIDLMKETGFAVDESSYQAPDGVTYPMLAGVKPL